MQCAKCLKDFKENEEKKGFYTQQNDHFMRPYRIHGIQCPHCGFHNTVFQITVGSPFIRTQRTYEKLDRIVDAFKNDSKDFLDKRLKAGEQLSLRIYGDDSE